MTETRPKDKHESLQRMREVLHEVQADPTSDPRVVETWQRLVHISERYCADEIDVEEWSRLSIAVWEEVLPAHEVARAVMEAD